MSITHLWPTGVGGTTRTFGAAPVAPVPTPTVPTPPPATAPEAGPWTRQRDPSIDRKVRDARERTIFIMEYDGQVVELPSPLLGDTQDLQSTVVNTRTRGGKQRVYRDQDWYTLHIFKYSFKHVRETLKDEFLLLTKTAMGNPIKITDHIANVYVDMYIVDVDPVVEEHDDGCSYSFGITLQVVR